MPTVEIRSVNDELIVKLDLPVFPNLGDKITIEREDYFRYYTVNDKWIRIDSNNVVVLCVSVDEND
jgi:hypothetical protein